MAQALGIDTRAKAWQKLRHRGRTRLPATTGYHWQESRVKAVWFSDVRAGSNADSTSNSASGMHSGSAPCAAVQSGPGWLIANPRFHPSGGLGAMIRYTGAHSHLVSGHGKKRWPRCKRPTLLCIYQRPRVSCRAGIPLLEGGNYHFLWFSESRDPTKASRRKALS